jgi:hypothetical protein
MSSPRAAAAPKPWRGAKPATITPEVWRGGELGLRLRYEKGDKHALFSVLYYCGYFKQRPPEWAAEAMANAHLKFVRGQIKSWENVFGKSFPGKRRAGLETSSRSFEIYGEVRRLREGAGMPIGQELFEEAAKNLKIGRKLRGESGWSTVRRIYYKERQHWEKLIPSGFWKPYWEKQRLQSSL